MILTAKILARKLDEEVTEKKKDCGVQPPVSYEQGDEAL